MKETMRSERIPALAIFDMDGTILDTLKDLQESCNYALRQFGCQERTAEEVRRFLGNGMEKLILRAVPDSCSEETARKILEVFKEHYRIHCVEHTCPYSGIPELLQRLKDRGLRIAVVSNKGDFGVQELCARYYPGLFDYAAGEKEGIRRKPAPDMTQEVLRQLGIDRADAVYIGDSEVDIATAANAGLSCISVTWGFREEEFLRDQGASRIVHTVEELETALLG